MKVIEQADLAVQFDAWTRSTPPEVSVAAFKDWLAQTPRELELAQPPSTRNDLLAVATWVSRAALDAKGLNGRMLWTATPHAVYSSKDPRKIALVSGDEHRLLGTLGTASHVAVDPKHFHTNHGVVEIGLVVSKHQHYRAAHHLIGVGRADPRHHEAALAAERQSIERQYIYGYLSYDGSRFVVIGADATLQPDQVDIAVFVSGTLDTADTKEPAGVISKNRPTGVPRRQAASKMHMAAQIQRRAHLRGTLSDANKERAERAQKMFDRQHKDRARDMDRRRGLIKEDQANKTTQNRAEIKALDVQITAAETVADAARQEYFDIMEASVSGVNRMQPVGRAEVVPAGAETNDFLQYVSDNNITTLDPNAPKKAPWTQIAHSEEWVVHVLRKHPELFVELLTKNGVPSGAKVYGVVIDIFSTRDVCAICQDAIQSLMKKDAGFLADLKGYLRGKGYVVTAEKHGLRLLPRVSSQIDFGIRRKIKAADPFTRIIDIKSADQRQLFTASAWSASMQQQNVFLLSQA